MFNNFLNSAGVFNDMNAIIAFLVAIICGFVISLTYMKTGNYTKNFVVSLFVLPLLVSVAIMLVNGSLGIGVAILGVFSLVRFRSLPGTSKEIINVFFSMIIGLAIGTGYIIFALIITLFISIVLIVLSKVNFGNRNKNYKTLKINVPEDFEYDEIFNEVFDKYLISYDIEKIKTINMGSMYEITYDIILKKDINTKKFIDELRVRNGNLKIILNSISEEKEL